MTKDEQERKKAVRRAFTELAQRRKNWPNKYSIGLQLSKWLCDYAFRSKVKPA